MKDKNGFTLAELIIVIGLLMLIFALSIRGLVNSQQSFIFQNSVEQVVQLVREARSLAVTGKAQPDFTDSDRDGASNVTVPPDYVAPAHYGVYFQKASGSTPAKITLFVDLSKGALDSVQNEGVYNAPGSSIGFGAYDPATGKDVKLAEFTLDDSLDLVLKPSPTNTVMFNPLFADTTFNPALVGNFFYFGVKEKATGGRERCYKIHPIAGVPEVVTDVTECA